MQNRKALAVTAVLGWALMPATALASAPVGVWVKAQQVVYAPDKANATRVQVHGALMLFDGVSGPTRPYANYTPPAFGYVYYECPQGQAETCRQEWNEIEANISAPQTTCVGFGADSLPPGTLRQPNSVAENADAYPIQIGVSAGYSPCQTLATFLSSGQGGAGGAGGTGSGGTTAGGTGTGGTATGGKPASTGGTDSGAGGKLASTGGTETSAGGKAAGGETPASSSAGSTATGSSKGGASPSDRAGSGSGNIDPNRPAGEEATDSKATGCSIAEATGRASLLGLVAAVGLVGLAFARRYRSRK